MNADEDTHHEAIITGPGKRPATQLFGEGDGKKLSAKQTKKYYLGEVQTLNSGSATEL